MRDWLFAAFGTLRIRPGDRRRLERATGNVPQRLLELVRHLLTTGVVRRDEHNGVGDWTCIGASTEAVDKSLAEVAYVIEIAGTKR